MKWFNDLPQERRNELNETVWIPVRDATAASLAALWGCSEREVGVEEAAEAAAWAAAFRTENPFVGPKGVA